MPIANFSNLTSIQGIIELPNANTGDMFWTLILWMIFFITLIISISFGFEVALLGASFLGLLLAIVLLYLGLVNVIFVGIFLGLVIFSIIYFMWASSQDK